jgi:hypothetical protein
MSNVIRFTPKREQTPDRTAGDGDAAGQLPAVLQGLRDIQALAGRDLVLAAYALEVSAHCLQAASGGVPLDLEKRIEDGLLEIGRLLRAVRDKLPDLRPG